ncbi:MAG: hypothetical protein U0794_18770 [Isosphaeraceae bacterium]
MSLTTRRWLVGTAVVLIAVGLVGAWAWTTAPIRGVVRVYVALLAAANRQDAEAARSLCTTRYAAIHPLKPAPDGGLVGLPRNIHKNFRAWREGEAVWLCPTNRVGPVYQFVEERGSWRFDGVVGLLRGRGEFVRMPESGLDDDLDAIPLPEPLRSN